MNGLSGDMSEMTDANDDSLSEDYLRAVKLVDRLESGDLFALSKEYRIIHADCLDVLIRCLIKVDELALFSSNESEEDLSTSALKYLSLNYYVARIIEKTPIDSARTSVDARMSASHLAARKYIEFLSELHQYGFVKLKPIIAGLEAMLPQGIKGSFNLNALTRGKASRKSKIELHRKLTSLTQQYQDAQTNWMSRGGSDEEDYRKLELARLELHQAKAWETLSSIAEELTILGTAASGFSIAPLQEREVPYVPSPYLGRVLVEMVSSRDGGSFEDLRNKIKEEQKNQTRLATRVEETADTNRLTGERGQVLRPFVITSGNTESRRNRAYSQVFGTGQKLPTVTIEELVEKELANRVKPDVKPEDLDYDEDADFRVDAQTMKDRKWDEFTEAVAKGSGNTLNMG